MPITFEINCWDELGQLRASWQKLQAVTPGSDFFRTLDWLTCYGAHFGAGRKLRTIVAVEDNEVVGIIPLVICPQQNRLGEFQVLSFPLDAWGSFYGPIGRNQELLIRLALEHLVGTSRDWDYIDLAWMDGRDGQHQLLLDVFREAGLEVRFRHSSQVPLVDLRQTWDEYWNSRSGNWRSNVRRNEKKLSKLGKVEFRRFRPEGEDEVDPDEARNWFEEAGAVAQASWQSSSEDGTTITHGTVHRFLSAMHDVAAECRGVDVNLLRIDGRPIAFHYNYHHAGHVSSLRLGFDREFARCGAGTVLTYRMLRDSFERGDHTFDFLPGALDAKRSWQTSIESPYSYTYIPRGRLRTELLRAKRWLTDWQTSEAG